MSGYLLSNFTDAEQIQLKLIVETAVDGPFFPDWEFGTLFGVVRSQVRDVIRRWDRLRSNDQEGFLAIHGALNNLSGYPHGEDAKLIDMAGITREQLIPLLERLRSPWGKSSANFFDRCE